MFQVHCFCTATSFLQTVAPCIFANCSVADQETTQQVAQSICNAASPPVELPSFQSLLNSSSSSAIASSTSVSGSGSPSSIVSKSGSGAAASSSVAASSSAAAATSHSSASGRIEGDMRIMMALAAMAGVIAIAFFAV
jgi:hypothetical protein